MEKATATHSSALAWKIPWTEEPGGLKSLGSQRVGHDWATSFSLFIFMHWRRKWQPTPVFLPGESQDGGAWWAAVYGVAHRVGHDWSGLAAVAAYIWSLWKSWKLGETDIIFPVWMKKLNWLREVYWPAQVHIANRWPCQGLQSRLLFPINISP